MVVKWTYAAKHNWYFTVRDGKAIRLNTSGTGDYPERGYKDGIIEDDAHMGYMWVNRAYISGNDIEYESLFDHEFDMDEDYPEIEELGDYIDVSSLVEIGDGTDLYDYSALREGND